MRGYGNDTTGFENLIYLQGNFPRHDQVFKNAYREHDIERVGSEIPGQAVGISDNIDIPACMNIESNISFTIAEEFPFAGTILQHSRSHLEDLGARNIIGHIHEHFPGRMERITGPIFDQRLVQKTQGNRIAFSN
jgi:hypothetical protein